MKVLVVIREKEIRENTGKKSNEIFPHPAGIFTRDCIASKLKQTCVKYRKTLDTGRQNGGGRIVITFFNICSKIVSGSPVTEIIEFGIESGDI